MNDSINFTPEETFNVDVEMENGFNTDILVKQVVTDDYETLKSKPQINNITLSGNLSLDDLNIQEKTTIPTKVSDLTNDSGYISQIKTINNQSLIGEGNIDIQGGGGSSDYSDLTNKPSINNVTLSGNKSLNDLGINIPTKVSDLTNDSGYITSYTETDPVFSASASANITSSDITNWDNKSPKLTILSYGSSTWNDFITAYNNNSVVYCRASSNSNPGTGTQGRMAFMAYINNPTNPTSVEFQYYRSVSSHSASQQGDQVFVYTLDKTNGWSVITREASSKIATSTGLTSSYSNGTLTLSSTIDISGKLDTSKVKSTSSTTSGDVYDVTYINSMLGNIESILEEI